VSDSFFPFVHHGAPFGQAPGSSKWDGLGRRVRCSGSLLMQKLQSYHQLEAWRHPAHVVNAKGRCDMSAVAPRFRLSSLELAHLCNVACSAQSRTNGHSSANLIQTPCANLKTLQPHLLQDALDARTTLHGLPRSANHHPRQRHHPRHPCASLRPRSTIGDQVRQHVASVDGTTWRVAGSRMKKRPFARCLNSLHCCLR